MDKLLDSVLSFLKTTGVYQLFAGGDWVKIAQYLIMYVIIGALLYLAIVKKFEPLLLMPIAFGMLLANLPGANLIHLEYFFDDYYFTQVVGTDGFLNAAPLQMEIDQFVSILTQYGMGDVFTAGTIEGTLDKIYTFNLANLSQEQLAFVEYAFDACFNGVATFSEGIYHVNMTTMIGEVVNHGGLIDILYLGVKLGIYPSLIFMGVGAMTDFSPLIANPKSLLMGAGAQLGVFFAFFGAILIGFTPFEAGAIGIIGGADGPTAILVTKTLAPHLLGAIAIAAYSYMALIPIIQPPFMRLLTTEKERKIRMGNLRPVSQAEKVLFPIIVTVVVCLIIPDAAALVGFLMLGNLFNVSGVTDRLSKTSQNELCNIVTICLGVSVGATANAENFLKLETIGIIALGLVAFIISTCGGLITGKIMCWITGGKINPLIGSAGVSAVPMAARVAQDEGRKADPSNFLLMHAMGPNVAGVIGSAVAAGVFLSFFA
ncbi:MAG: sodium ion-translocating decarboxylase subunit beta [Clostridia bacterium]|nr:sodium ion-translocating decarboxylase subunit beta [Clostridia bacterium]